MTLEQFNHVCRSAAAIANKDTITVFGAAAITPWHADVPAGPSASGWPSLELDVDPGTEELATLVDGCIGELSAFEDEFGVRAHGVTLDIFLAPPDWRDRARVFSEPASGTKVIAPHPHDLLVAKLVRGDERDWEYARYVVRLFPIDMRTLGERLEAVAAAHPNAAAAAREAAAAIARRGL